MGKTLEPKLRQLIKRGGDFDPQSGQDVVAAAAKEAGLAWFAADCDKARSRSAVFRAIVKAVDYPQFFGANFDGLYDCLCDTLLELTACSHRLRRLRRRALRVLDGRLRLALRPQRLGQLQP